MTAYTAVYRQTFFLLPSVGKVPFVVFSPDSHRQHMQELKGGKNVQLSDLSLKCDRPCHMVGQSLLDIWQCVHHTDDIMSTGHLTIYTSYWPNYARWSSDKLTMVNDDRIYNSQLMSVKTKFLDLGPIACHTTMVRSSKMVSKSDTALVNSWNLYFIALKFRPFTNQVMHIKYDE